MLGKWNISGNGSISQRVLDKVKPGTPLKNKIEVAQQRLELQISKLDSIHQKLQKKHDHVFKKIVDAQRSNNRGYAKAYAVELGEIRKMNGMIGGAKLAMEQIQIRLNTVSELGDVVVTLSPCMSVIKGLGTSLGGFMPEANSSMQDLSRLLGDVMSGSAVGGADLLVSNEQQGADTIAILEEAHAVIEGETKSNIPEIPSHLPEGQTLRKETFI